MRITIKSLRLWNEYFQVEHFFLEWRIGFEPMNTGFADQPLKPLGHPHELSYGRWIRTTDLELMKLTSYHCYTPWCWASSRVRTYDLLITSELLYQLSYWSEKGVRRVSNPWPLDPQTSTLPTELPTPYSCWGDRTRTCEVEWRLIYSQLSLPLENTPIKVEPCGFEPHSQDFQSCAYTKSAEAPSKSGSRRIAYHRLHSAIFKQAWMALVCTMIRTSGPDWINTLAVCRFQPLTHTSFLIDDAKVEGRSATFLRS